MSTMTRRSALMTLAATVFAAAPVLAASPKPAMLTADEKFTVSAMQSRGITRFLLLNKISGAMLGVDNGQVLFRVPALTGKIKGDEPRPNLGVTPAGIFTMEARGTTLDPYIVFLKRGIDSYAIHPVYHVRGQERDKRIASNVAADKKISLGCVNVTENDFWKAMDIVLGAPQSFQDMQGVARSGPVLVVMPETTTPQKYFAQTNGPAPQSPTP